MSAVIASCGPNTPPGMGRNRMLAQSCAPARSKKRIRSTPIRRNGSRISAPAPGNAAPMTWRHASSRAGWIQRYAPDSVRRLAGSFNSPSEAPSPRQMRAAARNLEPKLRPSASSRR